MHPPGLTGIWSMPARDLVDAGRLRRDLRNNAEP